MTTVSRPPRPPAPPVPPQGRPVDSRPPAGSGGARSVLGGVVGAMAAGVVAFAVAPYGKTALYALLAAIAVGVLIYSIWDLLGPVLHDAVRRVAPRRPAGALAPPRPWLTPFRLAFVVMAAGVGGWAVAQMGTKAILGVVALVLGTVAVWLLYPLIDDLLRTPPSDVADRSRPPTRAKAAPSRLTSTPMRVVITTATIVLAGVFAWGAAQMGLKGLIAIVGTIGGAGLFLYVRDRSVFFTFAAVSSLTFLLHKSFTTQDLTISGGAPSVYVSSFDVLVVLLYVLWISEGTFRRDVKAAMGRRILAVPLIGAVFLLPSMLVAVSVEHGVNELARMAWMYLLFFYVSVRVRTRRHVWAVLGGLAVFATLEMVVVVLQAKTGGVLGLSFLGVPTELGERVTDTESLGRPFGTIIHPVFMGAVMGSLAALALGVGLSLRRSLTKVAALGFVGVCLLPLYLANTRASLVAYVAVALVMVAVALRRGLLTWSTVGRLALCGLVVAALLFPQLSKTFSNSFNTAHFSEEVESRHELNDIAGEMIDDKPVLGVGLNNFELVMAPYEKYGIIFFNHPVHNLYLLYLSETGIVGFAGVVLVGVALYNVAIRLARSRDRLLGGIGLGISGAMGFLMIEELLGFSLRQDTPLALYWLLAGLAVACAQMAKRTAGPQLEARRRPAPGGSPGEPTERDRRPRTEEDIVAAARAAMAGHSFVPVVPKMDPNDPRWTGSANRTGSPTPVEVLDLDEMVDLGVWDDDSSWGDEPGWGDQGGWDDPAEIDLRELIDGPGADPAWLDELVSMSPGLGLAGAGSGSGSRPRPGAPSAARRWQSGVLGVILLAAAIAIPLSQAKPASGTEGLRITFTATERSTGVQGIYTANGDGGDVTRITPTDGRQYNWAQWAFGGTKIVYTVRTGPEGSPEAIEMMNADGSGAQTIRALQFQAGQPKVSPDGRSVVFTATSSHYQRFAIYKLDLETLEAVNLSAVTEPTGALDADPKFSPKGDRIIFASGDEDSADIDTMRPDGSDRVALTDDGHYNSDPELSPDERHFATASYRGPGVPGEPGTLIGLKPADWFLVVHDAATGDEHVLNDGKSCINREPANSCTPKETSAFKPVWTPDGTAIGYNGTLNRFTNCICVVDADGSNPRVLLAPTGLALDWFDWILPNPAQSPPVPDIGSEAKSSRLLVTAVGETGDSYLYAASPDQLDRAPIPLPAGISPENARWSADHRTIVFSARTPIDEGAVAPHPAPPPGSVRREHWTLDSMQLESVADAADPSEAERQVFVFNVDTGLQQLTDPWIEDWRDGLVSGDARANTEPVISPDGRYVVFKNTSTVTNESFLLRLDRVTGEVLNLTNGSAGAMRVDDANPAFSPDGSQIAFTWTQGSISDVYVMDTATGARVDTITEDDWVDSAPQFDGPNTVVAASWRAGDAPDAITASGWVVVRIDVATGEQQVLTGPLALPTRSLAVAPEGDRYLAVVWGPTNSDLVAVDPSGSSRLLQPTPYENELFVDWK